MEFSIARLTINLLGSAQLSLDGRELDVRVRKELALLAFLAVEQHRHSRETLVGLLWPEAPEQDARNNLRVVLSNLRRLLGDADPPFLDADRHSLAFDCASDHVLDVVRFRTLVANSRSHPHDAIERCDRCLAQLAEALALYRGDFLTGFSLADSVAFEEWATIQREQLQQQALDALNTLTTAYEQRGDYAAQCRYARRQLELEPWRESAYAQLMRGLWLSGQRAAALEQYHACRRILEAELGLQPSHELTALYEQIRTRERAEQSVVHGGLLEAEPKPQRSNFGTHTMGNLPASFTSFVGREADLVGIREALAKTRLVTLTGPGGTGKTRLALEVAAGLAPVYAEGVWFVELASLQDPALVPQAVAAALGLPALSGQSVSESLTGALRSRHMLMVVDNCEHLIQSCRDLAERLLAACPQLTIVATSRELLRVAGECVWPVPPLSVPDATVTTPDQLMNYEGIQLFVQRARAIQRRFNLTPYNAPVVAQICRRLDSIPLAIELAAARIGHLDPEKLLALLDDRFNLLKTDSSGTTRQQTLRAAIDWSYDLLSDSEQRCFRWLAVFAGSFTLPFAEAVVGATSGWHAETSVIDLLAHLIDKSLLVAEPSDQGMRYHFLESLGAYAQEKLLAAGEQSLARDRLLACCLQLAEEAEPHLFSADQVAWLDMLATEHHNLRAALDWAIEAGHAHAALRLITTLRSFWYTRGHYDEGRRRTLQVLAMPNAHMPTTTRAAALNAAAALLWAIDNAEVAVPLLNEALEIGRELGDPWNIGWALLHLGSIAYRQGDPVSAQPLLEDGLINCQMAGEAGRRGVGWGLMFLGDLALDTGDPERASQYFAQSVDCLRELSDGGLLAYPLRRLAHLALEQADFAAAKALCTESLRLNQAIDDQLAVVACLVAQAAIAAAQAQTINGVERTRHFHHVGHICGVVAAELETIGAPLWQADAATIERVASAVKTQLGEAAFAEDFAAGRTMTIDLLFDAGADQFAERSTQPAAPVHNLPTPLTACVGRDRELAELVTLAQSPAIRLITLLGVGGIGKTHLAIALGQMLTHHFTDGVFFVPLAALNDVSAIAPAILAALGNEIINGDPRQILFQTLRSKHMLLVLDNFEHLLGGTTIISDILERAPRIQVIATSRERLNLRGEHSYPMHGLSYARHLSLAEAAGTAAVRVFVQNAQRADHRFELNASNLAGVLRICQLVEGMPLGLELAAAWAESLSPAEIASEIEQSTDFLQVEWGDLPERQRSMRAVFEWSWRSLNDVERQVFKQLAIFRGGFTRQAAGAIVGASLPLLTRLTHKALLRVNGAHAGTGRYDQHELLRQFALGYLNDSAAEHGALAARHAAFYLELAETLTPDASNGEREAWITQIEREHDNIRAALAWAEGQADMTLGLRLALAVLPFWQSRCYLIEGRRWLEGFLRANDDIDPKLRADACYGAAWLVQNQDDFARADELLAEGMRLDQSQRGTNRTAEVLGYRGVMARSQGHYDQATALLTESLALFRTAQDHANIVDMIIQLAVVRRERGDYPQATAMYQELLETCRALNDKNGEGSAFLGLADIARDQGQFGQIKTPCMEALAIGREIEQRWLIGFALNNLALAAMMQNQCERAETFAAEALTLFQTYGIRGGVVQVLITQGQIACLQSDYGRAWSLLSEGLAQGWPSGPHWFLATAVEELARVAVAVGNAVHAARLCGGAAAWREAMGAPMQLYRLATYHETLNTARNELGEEAFTAAMEEGAGLQPKQLIAAALATPIEQAHALVATAPPLAMYLPGRYSMLSSPTLEYDGSGNA